MTEQVPAFEGCALEGDASGLYRLEIRGGKGLNILSSAVTRDLTEALRWLRGRREARALLLRGAGRRAFAGGADIGEMARLDPASARAFITRLSDLCETLRALPVPSVAAISGFCFGAGLEVAAACDLRLCSSDARFGMQEVRLGIPSVIHAALLPRLIGPGAANWLLLTGETVDAAQAERWGLVQAVAEPEALDALAERTLQSILACGPEAIRAQVALLRGWEEAPLAEALTRSIAAFGAAFEGAEAQSHLAAFLARKAEGRKPG